MFGQNWVLAFIELSDICFTTYVMAPALAQRVVLSHLSKPHTCLFFSQYELQLLRCCMQYGYNVDLLLHHHIVPWILTPSLKLCTVTCYCGFCYLSLSCRLPVLSRWDVQRIVGRNSMLVCILHNGTGCRRTSWCFCITAFDRKCIGPCWIVW